MVDNTLQIKTLLRFESEDDFYHLQIIKRKKEHPELGSNSYIVKTYYVSSLEYLDNKLSEIKSLCDFHNARGCINLNKRSFERIAFHVMQKVCHQIMNRDFRSVRKAYESVCGTHSNDSNKSWIVDLDTKDLKHIVEVSKFIKGCVPNPTIKALLPTKNGYHLITSPFNLEQFKKEYNIDIHKDNPTILYIS